MAAWAVSSCDGGHGAAAGCAQLLLRFAAECLQLFGALLQDIRESFELSWLAVWQNCLRSGCAILATSVTMSRIRQEAAACSKPKCRIF